MKTLQNSLLILVFGSVAAVSSAQTVEVTESLSFSTSGQSLWGPQVGERTKTFEVDLFDEGFRGSEGRIYEDVQVAVDNSTAVATWEGAVERCMDTCYGPQGLQVCPTRNQCINGARITYPCPTFTNPLRTCTQTIRGIGPRPAGSIDKVFDIGAELAWEASVRWVLEGGLTVDEGSLDVDVDAEVRLEVDGDDLAAGEIFTLRAVKVEEDASLRARWPSVSGSMVTRVGAVASLIATVAGPNTETGAQVRDRAVFIDERGDLYRQELGGFRVSPDGLELRVVGDSFRFVQDGLEVNVALPLEIPGFPVGVGLPIFDVGLFTPDLDLPPAEGFDGVHEFLPFDGERLVSGLAPGRRELFDWLVLDGGVKDTDVGRFDVDLDVLSAAGGMPLGIKATAGTVIPGVLDLLTAEGNILDVDGAFFFGFRERLTFEPRLEVELHFGRPVLVETEPGSGDFEAVASLRMAVGDERRLVHPGGDLEVRPVYSLAANRFINDTDFIASPILQGTIFELKLGGLLTTIAGGALGMPSNFAAAQLTVDLISEPLKLTDINFLDDSSAAAFSLGGFDEVAGQALVVPASPPVPFLRADSNGDGRLDIADASFGLNWLFLGGREPACLASLDANADAQVDISDISFVLIHLFRGGPAPAAPYPSCGAALAVGDALLGCERAVGGCR